MTCHRIHSVIADNQHGPLHRRFTVIAAFHFTKIVEAVTVNFNILYLFLSVIISWSYTGELQIKRLAFLLLNSNKQVIDVKLIYIEVCYGLTGKLCLNGLIVNKNLLRIAL